jgi:hypothetical protein
MTIEPVLMEMLKLLPEPGAVVDEARRKSIVSAFESLIGFLYPEAEGEVFSPPAETPAKGEPDDDDLPF